MQSQAVKFSEDIVPIGELKVNPGGLVKRINNAKRPVLITTRGKGVAVLQGLKDYEKSEDEKLFMKAILQGIKDIEMGKVLTIAQLEKRLTL